MQVFESGCLLAARSLSETDSITFADADTPMFECLRLSDTQIMITPSSPDITYIWVAVSDEDYRYYGYSSYQEAWQATVDIAIRYNFLETDMLSKGRIVIDLTNTFSAGHHVLAVAAWDGEKAVLPFTYFDFTLTATEQQNTASAVSNPNLSDNGNTALLVFWKDGQPADTIATAAIDSITFSSSPDYLRFNITISDITNISFHADILPSDTYAYYFADYILRADADQYSDSELATLWMQSNLQMLPYYYPGQSFKDAYLYKGEKHLSYNEGLLGNTDYYYLCFAVNPETAEVQSPVSKQLFRTAFQPTDPNLTFQIDYNPATYIFTITPSNLTSTYYYTFLWPTEASSEGMAKSVWKQNAEKYGNSYAEHGVLTTSVRYDLFSAGTYYLVVGGWDGTQTTDLSVYVLDVTEDMLPSF